MEVEAGGGKLNDSDNRGNTGVTTVLGSLWYIVILNQNSMITFILPAFREFYLVHGKYIAIQYMVIDRTGYF